MFASTATDVAALIVAIAGLIASAGAAYAAVRGLHVAAKVHTEVKTMNGLSIAQMADATETRRVDEIKPVDRTAGEQEHIDAEPRTEERP